MTFDEWNTFVAEANASGSQVRCQIAARADMPARYENETSELDFKSDVMNDGSQSWDSYNEACSRHPCKGEEIGQGSLPVHVVRTMRESTFLETAIWRSDPGGGYGNQPLTGALSELEWRRASELLPGDAQHETFFFPASTSDPASPEKRSVFANFEEDDPDPEQNNGPAPRLVDQAAGHVPGKGTLADCVIWLTASKARRRGAVMALVSYLHQELGPCRFPVPPDAGSIKDNDRFRPVSPGVDERYGRTWPVGVPAAGHLVLGNGVPEMVHWNRKVPITAVWALSLGAISGV